MEDESTAEPENQEESENVLSKVAEEGDRDVSAPNGDHPQSSSDIAITNLDSETRVVMTSRVENINDNTNLSLSTDLKPNSSENSPQNDPNNALQNINAPLLSEKAKEAKVKDDVKKEI